MDEVAAYNQACWKALAEADSSDMHPDGGATPGSWDHFVAYAPPWLTILARLEN